MSCCDFEVNDELCIKDDFKEDYDGSHPDRVGVVTKIQPMVASENSFSDSNLGCHWLHMTWTIGRFTTRNIVPCNTVRLTVERVNATNYVID